MLSRITARRTLTIAAIAVAVSVGSVAGVSFAQGTSPTPAAVTTPSAGVTNPGGILADVHVVLAGLVADGSINQQQADAVQAEANAGSIDPKQLTQSGTLTDAQMRAVAAKITQVKLDYRG